MKIELEDLRVKVKNNSLTADEVQNYRQQLVQKESEFNMAMERMQRSSSRK